MEGPASCKVAVSGGPGTPSAQDWPALRSWGHRQGLSRLASLQLRLLPPQVG